MDIGRSVSFVFEDETWIEKVVIGGLIGVATLLLSWTIIGAIAGAALITGYALELLRNVRRDKPQPLPEWDNWGDKIVEGLRVMVAGLIWALPLLIVGIPVFIVLALSGDSNFAAVLGLCFSCLSALYGIFLALVSPGIYIRLAETQRLSAALRFSEIVNFTRENLSDVIIAVIVVLAVSLVASIVGFVLCLVGIFFTSFWTTLVQSHLYAQIGRQTAFEPAADYDLSPDDVMPGVGEIDVEAQSAADEIVAEPEDVSEAAEEAEEAAEDIEVNLSDLEGGTDEEGKQE
ncbi:MAG: DUF4013 domain-containing protein [Caldilineae bacterium]|nr:MAG: DUF4013 domain-containing protein [Caldilineae bacterium]